MKRNSGFTLVELLVASLVGAIVLAGVFASYQYIQRQYARLSGQRIVQSMGRDVSRFLQRDLSMAGYTHRGSDGGYALGVMTESALSIDADKKGFAVVFDYEDPDTGDVQRQRVTYSLASYSNNNGQRWRLMRQVDVLAPVASAGAATILADYLDDFFIYQGESDVSSNLVACYGFNGDLDDSVASQAATANGSITYESGVASSALHLDGAGYAAVSNVTNLSFNDAFTVGFFIKPDDVSIADRVAVISKGANDYAIFLDQQRRVYVMQASQDGSINEILASEVSLPVNLFSHVAMVRDGGALTVYVNASPWSMTTETIGKISSDPLYFGLDGAGGYPSFEGAVDDLRFYARALPAAEVVSLASNAYQDCGASASQLTHVSFVVRSPKEIGAVRNFAPGSFMPLSVDYVPGEDAYMREAFTVAVFPKNL